VSVAHRITEPDRTITLYRFFGMVQISSVGFSPLLIWTRYFRLGHARIEDATLRAAMARLHPRSSNK